jgi:hypothetical protein
VSHQFEGVGEADGAGRDAEQVADPVDDYEARSITG